MSDTNNNTPKLTPKVETTPPQPKQAAAPQSQVKAVSRQPERVSYDPDGNRYIRTDPNYKP